MSILNFMKRNYKYLIPIVLIAGVLLSFKFNNEPDPVKDRAILEVLNYILREGHYQPKPIDDAFSKNIYKEFIEILDPSKHYFYQSDINDFKKFENQIDDQILNNDLTFFYSVYNKYIQRVEESKAYQKEALSKPITLTEDKDYNFDEEKLSFPKNKNEMQETWRLQMKMRYLGNLYDKETTEADLAKNDSTYVSKTFETLQKEALEATKKNMNDLYDRLKELNEDDYYALFLNVLSAQFDPHTNYFDPKIKKSFDISMSGKLEGIGARLQKEGEYTKVFELISGGPAWRSGELEVGDVILKVAQGDEEPLDIVGMRLDDAIEFIKGKKGTTVKLTLKKVDGTIKVIALVRDIVEIEETFVKSSIVEKNEKKYGIINLPKFYFDMDGKSFHNSADDMEKEIKNLKKEGVSGIMLDLRDNGGGSLKTAIDISGLFIDKGPVVQVKYRGEKPTIKDDEKSGILWDGPLVVLVNELSASASEIVAAALQDYGRAVVVGSKQTYGKGTVQNFYELNEYAKNKQDLGSLKMTIQKFYRINGGSTQLNGVVPDVIVPTRYSYLKIGERDEKFPLAWDKIAPANYSKWVGYENIDAVVNESSLRVNANETFNLINDNARWLDDNQKDNLISLNYNKYKEEIKANEEKAKTFNKIKEFNSGLNFNSPEYEKTLVANDTLLQKKRDVWHKELSEDIYVDEGLRILESLKVKSGGAVAVKP